MNEVLRRAEPSLQKRYPKIIWLLEKMKCKLNLDFIASPYADCQIISAK